MSHSYKKSPVRKTNTTGMKKAANRSFRRKNEDAANGKAYKKFFPSYDICDYTSRESFQEYKYWVKRMTNWRKLRGLSIEEKSEEQLFREWKKMYHRK